MKLLAVYHAGYLDSLGGARQLRRGRHLIRGGGEISGEIMAAVLGRIRNAAALARELNCGPRPEQIVTAAYRRWGQEYPRYIESKIPDIFYPLSVESRQKHFYSTSVLPAMPDNLWHIPASEGIQNLQNLFRSVVRGLV